MILLWFFDVHIIAHMYVVCNMNCGKIVAKLVIYSYKYWQIVSFLKTKRPQVCVLSLVEITEAWGRSHSEYDGKVQLIHPCTHFLLFYEKEPHFST